MNTKNTLNTLVLFLSALFVLTGCESSADEKALQVSGSGVALAQPAPLGSYLWALVEWEGESPPASRRLPLFVAQAGYLESPFGLKRRFVQLPGAPVE